jgi:GntR family transcriptional regulator
MSLPSLPATLSRHARGPLYLQFRQMLRQAIDDGSLLPDQALPSERELCERYQLSRVTVRKGLSGLVDEGRLIRRHGAGTFVRSVASSPTQTRVEKSFSKLSSSSEDMAARGLTPSSRWLSRASGQVTPEEALALTLSPGSPVHRFQRLRLADGRPMALEYTTLAGFCFDSIDMVGESLYLTLDEAGFRPSRALQRLRAMAFTAEQAELLTVAEGHAGLLIERRTFLEDGRAVEYTVSYYRGDAYDFVAELSAA